MTVYVDQSIWPYRGKLYCHMATDGDLEELHQMADQIGLKRCWFDTNPRHPHYDLAPSKRALAVEKGAREVTGLELIQICFKFKPCT